MPASLSVFVCFHETFVQVGQLFEPFSSKLRFAVTSPTDPPITAMRFSFKGYAKVNTEQYHAVSGLRLFTPTKSNLHTETDQLVLEIQNWLADMTKSATSAEGRDQVRCGDMLLGSQSLYNAGVGINAGVAS